MLLWYVSVRTSSHHCIKVLVVCTKYVLLVVVDNLQVSAEQFRVGQFKLCRKGCGIYRLEEVCN